MKCIEILIASGDQYFRQLSPEAIPMATQRYTEALTLFGPAPATIVSPTRPVTKRYDDIKSLVTDFATATMNMELEFPHFINTLVKGNSPPAGTRDGTLGFVRPTYFSIPANPAMQALRDLVDGRLYNILHGLDIDGNPRRLPLFDPPLDPGQLIAARAGGASLASLAGGRTEGPMPNCRAMFLLQKAQDLCAELRSLSESYLSIRERRGAEAMARLRARQETGVLSLLNDVRQHQVLEATSALETLAETRKSHIMRLEYVLALIGESTDMAPSSDGDWVDLDFGIRQPNKDELRVSAEEYLESAATESAAYTDKIATGIQQNAGLLMTLPSLALQAQPMGVGISTQMDASIIAKALLVGASVIQAATQASTDMASRAARKGQLVRQLQERRMCLLLLRLPRRPGIAC
ncbi:PA14 domain protein [Metarhizium robertsii ARSEF 23]|nr:PA14 domain protein [Metarhizium robertsii ARSEF 23]EFY99852.1 PA14 domain protein [Metarhizium robertsii ARSEF 23]